MKKFICTALLFTCTYGIAQSKNDLWKKGSSNENSERITKAKLPQKNIFVLNFSAMKSELSKSPKRDLISKTSNAIIPLPNQNGNTESFNVFESNIMAPELATKYPEIKTYVAVNSTNPSKIAYISATPLGFKAMITEPNKESLYIEPVSVTKNTYTVYKKSERQTELDKFECGVTDVVKESYTQSLANARGADDGKLRTFRLALSCTGEYANYFGGTKALALAGMVNTLTRVNAVFERDFGVRLVLIANTDSVIYTNASTDPYSTKAYWPNELQTNLTNTIGEANYDIGHLFDAVLGGGNAGCNGCVGVDGYKGRGYTSTLSIPEGDGFDIQYAAHEMAHQLGANHSFTYKTESGNQAQMEPGSASTIMGYAGVTIKDIQQQADDYFHAISIQQVTDNVRTKTCAGIILTNNATPVVNAGADYTIPKGTPFMLTGSATDSNATNILTYTWEQMDLGNATTTVPSASATTGPLFRSYAPSASATRYFPNMTTILAGLSTTQGYRIASETLPNVGRTLNFRLTARDNRIGGGANNTDDMIVTVNGTAGPFTVDSQNTAVSYAAGTSQTINWTVAGTTANGVNCTNVDILLSTDGGQTFPITLVAGTPNDGSQNIIIPSNPGTTNRIMVKGSNHIFFDVNNANFTITGSATADTVAPTASTLSASGTTASSTNLSWTAATDNVGVTGYDVYQNGVFKTTTSATTLAVTSLAAATTYNFYVKAKDAAGNVSSNSNTVNVTTTTLADTSIPTASTLSASGTTTSSTNLTWTAATDNIGVTGYDIYQNGVLKTSTVVTTAIVNGLSASTTYQFYVKAKDAAGNVSSNSNTVNITTAALADTTVPSSVILTAANTTANSTELSWSTATDNIGVVSYDVYQNGIFKTTTTATTLSVANLIPATNYTFTVKAKDAAGNSSLTSNPATAITLTNTGISYCQSSGGTNSEYINRVQIGTIDNQSGNNNGYGNYTMQSTSVRQGETVSIAIIPTWNGRSVNEFYNVWIDFNQDGNFNDHELVFTKARTKATTVSGNITIPQDALIGSTRMRISMKSSSLPTACQLFSNGEVEDYTVRINTSLLSKGDYNAISSEEAKTETLNIKLYPNPVTDGTIHLSGIDTDASYSVYNLSGQQMVTGTTNNNSIDINKLTAGIYLLEITNGSFVTTKRFIKN